jgi:digalactosyldiacylglycerol synthase
VSPNFFELPRPTEPTCYYIGKMLWAKGYQELLDFYHHWEVMFQNNQTSLKPPKIDLYGSGENSDDIKKRIDDLNLFEKITTNPGIDHASPTIQPYSVFINPSTSDVLCTTTAEALAMGKIVVIAKHVSNEFFYQFPNCLTFEGPHDFAEKVAEAVQRSKQVQNKMT